MQFPRGLIEEVTALIYALGPIALFPARARLAKVCGECSSGVTFALLTLALPETTRRFGCDVTFTPFI
jgi:hypothetical protein